MSAPIDLTPLSICPLASGSKGNSYWIEANGTAILVDAGLSMRRLSHRVEEIGRDLQDVQHVFITHEHFDHVQAMSQLLKKHRPTVWATRGTLRAIRQHIPDGASVRMLNGRVESAGAFKASALSVSHDAAEPVMFHFATEGASAAVVTDLGVWDGQTAELTQRADVVVCEANHDPHMLAAGRYPAVIKRRIASPRGHLSNEEGAALAVQAVRGGAGSVILGHLSESNNSPSLALDVFGESMANAGLKARIDLAHQDRPGPWISVAPRRTKETDEGR